MLHDNISEKEYKKALAIVRGYKKQNKPIKQVATAKIIDKISNGCNVKIEGRKVSRINDATIRSIMDDCPFIDSICNDDIDNNILEIVFTGSPYRHIPDSYFIFIETSIAKRLKIKILS